MTTTKTILTMAVIAVLPFTAMAENISVAMYNAPAHADNNHPAPTTQADAPYGRANIDTADQEHIATTAYVKGAYNSAIAAVNKLGDDIDEKQDKFFSTDNFANFSMTIDRQVAGVLETLSFVSDADEPMSEPFLDTFMAENEARINDSDFDSKLITAAGVLMGIDYKLDKKRVDIYTTWDTDATTQVALSTAN